MTAAEDQLTVFDVCSLALYGTHALPIRIKIVIVSQGSYFLSFLESHTHSNECTILLTSCEK